MSKKRLLATTLLSGAVAGAMAAPSFAQDDEIVVTGSRIAKKDFTSNSPVHTVDAEQFQLTGTVNAEDLINDLPQTIPGLDRSSNNPGNGTATIDLRGLGSSRTLVLVNGKRVVPSTQGNVVDINIIPTALIENVEVLTGGGSSVYGSDAVAGVVNFIMKDDFEGMEFNVSGSGTQEGDAFDYGADITIGTNFDGGRGNVVFSAGYFGRESLFQDDRDFSFFALADDGPGQLRNGGSSGVPGTRVFTSVDFTAAGVYQPGSCPEGTTDTGAACVGGITFAPDGSPIVFDTVGADNSFFNYAPDNYLQLPMERYNANSFFHYDLNDDVTFFGSFLYAQNRVPQQLAPTPAFTSVTFQLDNPFFTPATRAAFATSPYRYDLDGDGIVESNIEFVGRRMVEVGPRKSNDDRNAFQMQLGFEGDDAFGTGIGWEAYIQHGNVQNNNDLEGDVSGARFIQAVDATTDANGNPVCRDQSNGCVPINIWGAGNISPEAADFVRTRLNAKTDITQNIAGLNLTGEFGFLDLGAGPVQWAGGLEYREFDSDFRPSQDLATGNVLGFNGAPPVGGTYDVKEAYMELYIPVFEGVPFADILAFELAGRVGDNSIVGNTDAYKVAAEWAPVPDIRFSANYNTTTREPNIGELFAPASNGFPGATDPCGPFNGNAPDPAIAQLCQATGVANFGTYQQSNSQIEGLFGGNPNLDAEEGETLTIGAYWSPSFIEGLTASLSYYDIEIEGYVTTFGGSVDNILASCYSTATNPGLDAQNVFCQSITRRANGQIDNVAANLQNAGFLETDGFDLAIEYTTEFADLGLESIPGAFQFSYIGTFLNNWELQPVAGDPTSAVNCTGRFGLQCDDPYTEYNHYAQFGWAWDSYKLQLGWQYLGEVEDDSNDGSDSIPTIDSINYFELSGSWNVNDVIELYGGIDNLLDEEPPILGDNQEQANTYPATYDVYGRTFFAGAKFRF